MVRPSIQSVGYVVALAGCFVLAMVAGWTTFGMQIDSDAYDFLMRLNPADARDSAAILLAIDEETLMSMGGMRSVRSILAEGVGSVTSAGPKTVVVDLILADRGEEEEDRRLEEVFAEAPNLVLSSDLIPGAWEDPLPRFRAVAEAVGHVHADPDQFDNVTRRIPLEKATRTQRRWALSLEAFRLYREIEHIIESPASLDLGGLEVPVSRDNARSMYIRFLRRPAEALSSIPMVSIAELRRSPDLAARFRDKAVFVGVTAQSAADDRHMTPYSAGQPMPGVEIHAIAFETLRRGRFLTHVSDSVVVLFCVLITIAAGVTFAYRSGWQAYLLGAALIVAVHLAPLFAFGADLVFSYTAPVAATWLSLAGAATYQHFVVRRALKKSETARSQYQQAIHFVTHEMRSPLTAIQGSSELMGRYQLPEEKSKQLAQMINSESKRLARMIQTFLDVERLSQGQMELKRESFQVVTIVEACLERVQPLADRKKIGLSVETIADRSVTGDRELMEYAVYNLLNNAVKYSPAETEITVFTEETGDELRLSVRDQGIGMDEKEIKSVFKKFYRTKKAEASGVAGTGIGLSIVEQIVAHHGGRMEVTSKPGAGSCFTMVLPSPVSAAAAG